MTKKLDTIVDRWDEYIDKVYPDDKEKPKSKKLTKLKPCIIPGCKEMIPDVKSFKFCKVHGTQKAKYHSVNSGIEFTCGFPKCGKVMPKTTNSKYCDKHSKLRKKINNTRKWIDLMKEVENNAISES
jgi:hypothetical protein